MEKRIGFAEKVFELKKVKRKGWVEHGLNHVESVADHSFGVTILAYSFADKFKVNKNKCIRIALVHDIAESIVGDITPRDNVSAEKKFEMEKKAMQKLAKLSGNKEIMKLWKEYAENKTKNAKFVKEMDKLETLMQALIYEKENKSKRVNLEDYWIGLKKKINSKEGNIIYNLLVKRRKGNK